MRIFLIGTGMGMVILATGGACAAVPPLSAPPPSTSTSVSTSASTSSSSNVDNVDLTLSPSGVSPSVLSPAPAREPAPAGLFVEMRASSHPGYDRLVFEFGGGKPPPHRVMTVDEVRQDPTDKLISLQGNHFLVIAFDGATLDTARWELDPAKARQYNGPQRITPGLPVLKEVAIAGDFEAVLRFGLGLSGKAGMEVQELSSPARLVIDFRGQ